MDVMDARADTLIPTLSHRGEEEISTDFSTILDRSPRPSGEGIRARGEACAERLTLTAKALKIAG